MQRLSKNLGLSLVALVSCANTFAADGEPVARHVDADAYPDDLSRTSFIAQARPGRELPARRLKRSGNTASGRVLGVGQCKADDLYRALDWLHEAQPSSGAWHAGI